MSDPVLWAAAVAAPVAAGAMIGAIVRRLGLDILDAMIAAGALGLAALLFSWAAS